MEKIVFHLEIFTNGNDLEKYFFENSNNNIIDLGKGIHVYKESSNINQLKMQIQINKEETMSYDDSLRKTILSNIMASWLIYKLTGKEINLLINGCQVPPKKNPLKTCFEKIIENNL
jgi:hypothetical protein